MKQRVLEVFCLTTGLENFFFLIPVAVEKSNKRALHQRRSVPYLIVTLVLLLFPLPPPPVLSRAVEPQHEHQQRQQHQAHGQGQQHALQYARGAVRGCGESDKTLSLKSVQVAAVKRRQRGLWVNKEALTAVDGQVDVAVLCSQEVCGRAAIQAGRLRWHVDNLDGARQQIPWERESH